MTQNYNPLVYGLVLMVIALSAIFLLGNNLTKVTLVTFEVDEIGGFSDKGFTMNGTVTLKNPSRISVSIDSINYDISLKETGDILSSGVIPSFVLEKNAVTTVPFQQNVGWNIGLKQAFSLSRKEKVEVRINGMININVPGENSYQIPFEKTIDIKEKVKEILKDKLSFWN
ncbi:LEA type 2 family protein [Candidatus Woesearchaeota archaeon]|nr:LEA type 2 family protein [Candidatus Woesearchaeota archaeon]